MKLALQPVSTYVLKFFFIYTTVYDQTIDENNSPKAKGKTVSQDVSFKHFTWSSTVIYN